MPFNEVEQAHMGQKIYWSAAKSCSKDQCLLYQSQVGIHDLSLEGSGGEVSDIAGENTSKG